MSQWLVEALILVKALTLVEVLFQVWYSRSAYHACIWLDHNPVSHDRLLHGVFMAPA
jgi:hypothetical protein